MRHSWNVESGGIFDVPTGDPALTTPGGFSNADGYGPYTLGPGQSIHIVIAEGVAGLSRDKCIELGKWYKKNYTASGAAKAKNDTAFTGKDSLFQTFRRAIANYMTGFSAPAAPDPPSSFSVSSGDPINLTWDVANPSDPNLKGFRIYRAVGDFYQPFIPLATLPPTARSYDDNTAVRGNACFYYISSIGDPALNTGAALTPKDTLFSNRIYTQTYTPAYLQPKRPAGTKLSDIRIVPNPYVISSDPAKLRFPGEPDKIAFFNIPARCKISIYTELGELIDEIQHTSGSGDEYWNSITSSRQVIVSGIYIVVFEDLDSGQRAIQKLSVIR
jgi:hypothetical protein